MNDSESPVPNSPIVNKICPIKVHSPKTQANFTAECIGSASNGREQDLAGFQAVVQDDPYIIWTQFLMTMNLDTSDISTAMEDLKHHWVDCQAAPT